MSQFKSAVVGAGTRLQSGIPKRRSSNSPSESSGLLLRGVVTATYVLDDAAHPFADDPTSVPTAVYCDVLTFGRKWFSLPKCLVSQERSGLHSGHIWKPRAASLTITGDPVDMNKGTNPAILDGDHVLIGFLDQNLNQPIILRELPHPAADVGNEDKETGHRLKLVDGDGDPDFWKHHGVFYGVTDEGDFVVDTTRANDGELQDDGKESDPPEDGTSGNHKIRLQKGATLTVEIEAGATFEVTDKDGDATMTIGDGAVHVSIYEALQTFWDTTVKPKFDAFDGHTHLYVMPLIPAPGPPIITAPPVPLVVFPALDTAIQSTKVSIPDG